MRAQEDRRKEKRVSWFRVIPSWIAGIVIQAPIYMALGIEFVKSPFIMVLFLWMAVAAAAIVFCDELGSRKHGRKSSRRKVSDLLLQDM